MPKSVQVMTGHAATAVTACAALMLSAPPAWSQGNPNAGQNGGSPLDGLHRALHLSPQQEPAWSTYRAQETAPTRAQDRQRAAAAMFPKLRAPQRMDLVEAELRQELADLDQQSQALKAFYATLSPDQKAIFDAQTLPPAQSQQQ